MEEMKRKLLEFISDYHYYITDEDDGITRDVIEVEEIVKFINEYKGGVNNGKIIKRIRKN